MESYGTSRMSSTISVSIPFKREGAWKADTIVDVIDDEVQVVSIPFKREGAWKVDDTGDITIEGIKEFQFPSNGKEHGKLLWV